MTFFDTAEVYGPYSNEDLVGEAFEPVRNGVAIATRFDSRSSMERAALKSRPSQIRGRRCIAVTTSHRSLRFLLPGSRDSDVPIEDGAGAVVDLIGEGKSGTSDCRRRQRRRRREPNGVGKAFENDETQRVGGRRADRHAHAELPHLAR